MNTDDAKGYVRRHALSVSLSTITSLLTVGTAIWFLAKPHLITAVQIAVADDIKTQVEEGTKPLNNAFKTILLRQINRLRIEISVLESKRRREPSTWTTDDARLLEEKIIELEDLQAAYRNL